MDQDSGRERMSPGVGGSGPCGTRDECVNRQKEGRTRISKQQERQDASVDRGIYCQTFANGQVQIGAGDFAFYVRHGWLIEGGKLTRPIKDVNLVGNGPKVLETVEMVGNDLVIDEGGWTCGKDGQSMPVSQGMPTVKVSRLSVGGAS